MPVNRLPRTLRIATQEDEEFLLHLYTVSRLDELRGTGWGDAQIATLLKSQYSIRQSQYLANYPAAQNWIILVGEERVGRILIQRDPVQWALIDLVVLPAFQGQGIGTSVCEQILQQAVETGHSVGLHVRIDNPAKRIYQRLGFVETGRTDGVYCEMIYSCR